MEVVYIVWEISTTSSSRSIKRIFESAVKAAAYTRSMNESSSKREFNYTTEVREVD